MEWIETTGKTVAEARDLALDQLGVDESEAEFEILQEPKPGLFGRTRGTARIRARVSPKSPRPKNDRKRRPKKKSGGDSDSDSSESSTAEASETKTEKAPPKPDGGREPRQRSGGSKPPAQKGASDDSGKRSNRASTQAATSGGPADQSEGRGTDGRNARGPRRTDREPMDQDEQVRIVETFLIDLVVGFGLSARTETEFEDRDLSVNLIGDDLGILVGPRLATLEAIQEITRLSLQREAEGKEYARVSVDVSGIRQLRRKSLEEFVKSAAERVQAEGSTVVFEDMSSADRKQVHDLAAEIDGIHSVSEGEDPRRRVALKAD